MTNKHEIPAAVKRAGAYLKNGKRITLKRGTCQLIKDAEACGKYTRIYCDMATGRVWAKWYNCGNSWDMFPLDSEIYEISARGADAYMGNPPGLRQRIIDGVKDDEAVINLVTEKIAAYNKP